jgi:penicillin-binding protein 2
VRRQDQLPWNRRNHALFVCYAPECAPLAVSVVVEHGGGGSSAAAPIGRDVILAAQTGGLPPLARPIPQPQRNRIEAMLREIAARSDLRPVPEDR